MGQLPLQMMILASAKFLLGSPAMAEQEAQSMREAVLVRWVWKLMVAVGAVLMKPLAWVVSCFLWSTSCCSGWFGWMGSFTARCAPPRRTQRFD